MSTATNIPVPETVGISVVPRAEGAEFQRRMGSISRHSAAYFAGTLFSAVAGYFFKIYVARALGAEALGLYALGMSIVAAVGIFNAVGLPAAGARFVAEYSSKHDYVRLGSFLRGGLSVLGVGNLLLGGILLLVAPWIAIHFYHSPALAKYAWSFALIMLFGVMSTFLGQCMGGFQAVARRTLITHFAGTSATIILGVLLISLRFGLRGYLIAQVISAALVVALMMAAIWQLMPQQARNTHGFGQFDTKVVAFSATAFGLAGVHFVLAQADKIALGYYLDPKQVGIYAVAMAFAGFIPIALLSVNQIFSPTIAELHSAGSHELLEKLYPSLTKWVLIVTLPGALTVIVFSRALMTIFGPGFESGGTVLAVGAIGQLFNCAVGSVGYLLLMSGNQMQLMKIHASNAVLTIVLNVLLVPRLGILGAAIAASATVAVTNLWCLASVRRNLKLFPYDRTYRKLAWPTLAAAGILALQRQVLGLDSWRQAGTGLIGAYAAFAGVLLLLGVGAEDRMLAHVAWKRIRSAAGMGRFS
jgi:O-antigen/teichoic acid export membrane protein